VKWHHLSPAISHRATQMPQNEKNPQKPNQKRMLLVRKETYMAFNLCIFLYFDTYLYWKDTSFQKNQRKNAKKK